MTCLKSNFRIDVYSYTIQTKYPIYIDITLVTAFTFDFWVKIADEFKIF